MQKNSNHLIGPVYKLVRVATGITMITTLGASIFLTPTFPPVERAEAAESQPLELKPMAKEEKQMLRKYLEENNIGSPVIQMKMEVKPKPKPKPESKPKPKPKLVFIPQYGDYTTYDLRNPSHLTAKQINKIVAGTRLEGLGWAYVEAEVKYGVNALYLLSHSALESGWGDSPIARSKNNLFGFTAYDHDPASSASGFKTKADCILTVANYISKEYFNPKGEHFNGRTLVGMNKKYASDDDWANKINEIMLSVQDKVGA